MDLAGRAAAPASLLLFIALAISAAPEAASLSLPRDEARASAGPSPGDCGRPRLEPSPSTSVRRCQSPLRPHLFSERRRRQNRAASRRLRTAGGGVLARWAPT